MAGNSTSSTRRKHSRREQYVMPKIPKLQTFFKVLWAELPREEKDVEIYVDTCTLTLISMYVRVSSGTPFPVEQMFKRVLSPIPEDVEAAGSLF